MEKVKYDYFVVVKKSTYLSFLYFCTWKIMRQINTNMFHFLKKYSPDYAQNTIEGWSIILVVAVGCEVSSLANSWLGMCCMFLIGALCAHIIACIIKYCMTNRWFKGFITDWSVISFSVYLLLKRTGKILLTAVAFVPVVSRCAYTQQSLSDSCYDSWHTQQPLCLHQDKEWCQ